MADLQNIADTMGGVGAALTGDLSNWNRNKMLAKESGDRTDMLQKDQIAKFDTMRKQTMLQDSVTASAFLAAGDKQGAMAALRLFQDRIPYLKQLGQNTDASQWVVDELTAGINGDQERLERVTTNLRTVANVARENGMMGGTKARGFIGTPQPFTRDGKSYLGGMYEDANGNVSWKEKRIPGEMISRTGETPAQTEARLIREAGGKAGASTRATNEENLVSKPPVDMASAEATVVGKAQGEAKVALPNILANAEYMMATIDKAISHPGIDVGTGRSSKLDPRNIMPESDAFEFGLIDDQIQGQTFMQAYQSLKGGGTITEIESEKATTALQRMKTAQSKESYIAAAEEFKNVIRGSMERARGATGATGGGKKDGVLKIDANGNKAMVYPDGSFEEVK